MVGGALWGLGAVAWLCAAGQGGAVRFTGAPASEARVVEKSSRGDPSWRKGRPASSDELRVTSSSSSAMPGEHISVAVSASEASVVRAEIFRLGVYGGTGAAKVWSGGPYPVSTLPGCSRAPCPERPTFSFEVARDWAPGLYLVKVTRADGLRSFTSIVVTARPAPDPNS